jgi:hypothetical protein
MSHFIALMAIVATYMIAMGVRRKWRMYKLQRTFWRWLNHESRSSR